MVVQRQLPEFARSDWYSDRSDHRCPHDAWLESFEIAELADGQRKEKRRTAIVARLLGAYHDGTIVFRYSGVTKFSVASDAAERGLGDWLEDVFEIEGSAIVHRITWETGSWVITAEDVAYEWLPKPG